MKEIDVQILEEEKAKNRVDALGFNKIVSKKPRGFMKQPKVKTERMKTFYPKNKTEKEAVQNHIKQLKQRIADRG